MNCVSPLWERPYVQTRPSENGWRLIQATVFAPSPASSANVRWVPSDANRPLVSWTTTANPSATARSGSSAGRTMLLNELDLS